MATFQKVYQFIEDVMGGVHNLKTGTSHVCKIALTNTAPTTASAVLADITQIANGNGYTTGGISIGTITGAQVTGTFKFIGGTDPVWTGSGAGMATFRYAVLYNDTPTSPVDPIIGFYDYGVGIALGVGDTFTIDLDQTNGIFTAS